jgi:hypothetical protein
MVPPDFLVFTYLISQLEGFTPQKDKLCKQGTHEAAISFATTANGAGTDGETAS